MTRWPARFAVVAYSSLRISRAKRDATEVTVAPQTNTELRLPPHTLNPGAAVVELWHDGRFIGQVTGADGPGVRLVTKHPVKVGMVDELVVEPLIELREGSNGKN